VIRVKDVTRFSLARHLLTSIAQPLNGLGINPGNQLPRGKCMHGFGGFRKVSTFLSKTLKQSSNDDTKYWFRRLHPLQYVRTVTSLRPFPQLCPSVPPGAVCLFAFGCAVPLDPQAPPTLYLLPGESVTTELRHPAQHPGFQISSVVLCDRFHLIGRFATTAGTQLHTQSPAAQPCTRLHPPYPTTHLEKCYAVRHPGPSTRGYVPLSLTPREQSSTRPVTFQYGTYLMWWLWAPLFSKSCRLSKNVDTIC
jgi:hypothetical protein